MIPRVVGMGIGLAENGDDLTFIMYTEVNRASTVLNRIPKWLKTSGVRVIESGEFKATR